MPLPPITGPLRVNPDNKRFFLDGQGRAVVLAGMHTWTNLQDADNHGDQDPPPAFDWDTYLDTVTGYGQNFVRLWNLEYADLRDSTNKPHLHPVVWQRTGPGTDSLGKPRFDLTRLNPAYFARLERRVAQAQERGVYVGFMFFEGVWSSRQAHWHGHPFNAANNVNGIDVPPVEGTEDGWGYGSNVHSLDDPEVVAVQQRYVREVIDTIGTYDNVLWEISNEDWGSPANVAWQHAMIDFIHRYEAGRPKQHPVGMTPLWNNTNKVFWASDAEWVSPCDCRDRPTDENGGQSYMWDPIDATGEKVVLVDTDHIFGVGGDGVWVWKNFLRGGNPLYMYEPEGSSGPRSAVVSDESTGGALSAMGDVVACGRLIDLTRAVPRRDLASTRYVLADIGHAYLVYQPESGPFTVRLTAGRFTVRWLEPATRDWHDAAPVTVPADGPQEFTPPFPGTAVLLLRRAPHGGDGA